MLRFLRFKKFNLPEAMTAYAQYCKSRDMYPFCYKHLDVDEHFVHDLFLRGYVFPLPERDAHGRTIVFIRNGAFGQRFGHRGTDLYRSLVMTLETLLLDDDNQKKGLVYVVDFEGQSLSDVAYVGILESQKLARSGEVTELLDCVTIMNACSEHGALLQQKCFPVQHKEAHWVIYRITKLE